MRLTHFTPVLLIARRVDDEIHAVLGPVEHLADVPRRRPVVLLARYVDAHHGKVGEHVAEADPADHGGEALVAGRDCVLDVGAVTVCDYINVFVLLKR